MVIKPWKSGAEPRARRSSRLKQLLKESLKLLCETNLLKSERLQWGAERRQAAVSSVPFPQKCWLTERQGGSQLVQRSVSRQWSAVRVGAPWGHGSPEGAWTCVGSCSLHWAGGPWIQEGQTSPFVPKGLRSPSCCAFIFVFIFNLLGQNPCDPLGELGRGCLSFGCTFPANPQSL